MTPHPSCTRTILVLEDPAPFDPNQMQCKLFAQDDKRFEEELLSVQWATSHSIIRSLRRVLNHHVGPIFQEMCKIKTILIPQWFRHPLLDHMSEFEIQFWMEEDAARNSDDPSRIINVVAPNAWTPRMMAGVLSYTQFV